MSLDNKSLDGERGKKEILRVINYYFKLNNIVYVDGIKKKERENKDQVSEN